MTTIDEWYKTKLEILTARDEARNLMKRAPLDSFVLLVKSEMPEKLMEPNEWSVLYKKYKETGRLS